MSDTDSLILSLDDSDEDNYKSSESKPEKVIKSSKGIKDLKNVKIGIIGAGKLAHAIVCGIIGHTDIEAKNICVSAKTDNNLFKFKEKGCEVTKRNYDVFTRFDCDIIFLCFNSSVIKQCYRIGSEDKPIPFTIDYIPVPNHSLNILSLVSGISLKQISECLIDPKQIEEFTLAIHRLVLNSSVTYGSKSGFGVIDVPLEECHPLVQQLLSKISTFETFPESEMDNICSFSSTALLFSHYCGSGLAEAASTLGLDNNNSKKMCGYAMLTAAQTVLKSGKNPVDLVEESISISSNTLPAIQLLQDLDIGLVLETAFDAVCQRIKVLNDSID